jgi:hypothetical protein
MSSDAVRRVIATIFSAQKTLRELAPEFNWAGMGNLLGDYGEYLALNFYSLVKAPAGSNGFDAYDSKGRKVQIKANHASSTVGFRGHADLLLVLHIRESGEFEEVFFGDFEQVKRLSSYSQRDNKHTITISKLKQLRIKNKLDEEQVLTGE